MNNQNTRKNIHGNGHSPDPDFIYSIDQLLRLACISDAEYEDLIKNMAATYMKMREGKYVSSRDRFYAKWNIIQRYLPRVDYVDGVKTIKLKLQQN